jgi:MSHA biogenesis protein MshG
MAFFSYKGRSARGELVTGGLDGETAEAVATRLFNSGITPLEIKPAGAGAQQLDLGAVWRSLGGGKPKTSDLVLFSRQMYTITKSGIPLLRGLRGLSASTHNAVLRLALEDILSSLESGRDLAESFGRNAHVFPPLYVSIVRVGEATGTLEASFLRLAEYLTLDQEIRDRVKAAMRYPMIVMIVIAAALGVLTTFVIPKFAPLFQALGDHIPWPTRVIIGVSDFAQHDWHLLLGGIAIAIFATRKYVSTESGRYRWDKMKLSLPVLGKLAHEAILARVSRSLSISLTAGMPMLQALQIIAKSAGNEYMAALVIRLHDSVERGESLSRAAAAVGMFPPLVLQMMAVGEETGAISELLEDVAGFYEREVSFALKNLSAALEPILIVFVGGMVLTLALGIFLPLWEMIGHAQGG